MPAASLGAAALEIQESILIEQVVANEAPSIGVAYLLAVFLGLLGAHRFYLKRPVSAVLLILSNLVLVGPIWVIVDLFLIPGLIRQAKGRIRHREMERLLMLRRGPA